MTNSSRVEALAVPSAKVAARLGMEGFEGDMLINSLEALGACSSRADLLILSEQLITYSAPRGDLSMSSERVPFSLPWL
jgi:hypothetical protein